MKSVRLSYWGPITMLVILGLGGGGGGGGGKKGGKNQ